MTKSSTYTTDASSSQALPTGTLTFLLTDIEGSTRLWEQYPQHMPAAMARHDALIELAVAQQSGRVVRPRGEGDSRFAVFSRASDGLRAAIAIQRLISAEAWMVPELRVRIALHTGEASLRDGDYYGGAVNRCARLRNAAHGGQILVSQATFCLTLDELPADVSLRDLGEHKLKDLERSEHIFQAVVPDLPSDFSPLTTSDHIPNNLPSMLTSFVGRKVELEELEHLLWQSRLITVAGPGGVGKTRLAIQVAQNVLASFPGGVWFIDLAPLSDATLLSQYLLNLLGIREEAGSSPEHTLMEALHSETTLLILDNCEHLLPAVALLADVLLRGSPGLRVLATSREKLGAAGEVIWRIPPLSTPDSKVSTSFETLLQYEAVKLFQDRAAAARSDFKITEENGEAVAQICAHLDGIPLAIELAAARVNVLSVEEILTRLDNRFRLLVGSRIALPRQQTLRALVDWSYGLLTEKERALLRRLSIFVGGWTLDAVEQICTDARIEEWEVLDLLTSLIDKSLVIADVQNGHERYRFLETILEFSHERLAESRETDELSQKHALYYLQLAENSYGKMWSPDQAAWLVRLDEEYDNLRTALSRLSRVAGGEEMMLKMAGSLWRYWEIRGYMTEGRTWLDIALQKIPTTPDYWVANSLSGAGHLARQQGDYGTAKTLHAQSLDIFRALGRKKDIARQLFALAEIAQYQGDYESAEQLHEESLKLRYEIGDKEGIATSLRQLGAIARDRGQYQHARDILEGSLRLERELGNKLSIALSLNDLGVVAYHLCEYKQAVMLFTEALNLQRELNDRLGISTSLQNLGNIAKDQGDFKQAELLYKECLELKKGLGDKRGIAQIITMLAEVAFMQGKYPLADDLAAQSLAISRAVGIKRAMLHALEVRGFAAFYQGNFETAASYAEEALDLSTRMNALQAIGYAKMLMALGMYSSGNMVQARDGFGEVLSIFTQIKDWRNVAITYVNLARTTYRLGDHDAASHYLQESLSISRELNIRWTLGFVLEIMGLLQRKVGAYDRALELFQESLRLSVEQDNQQGIANCLGALAGLAALTSQPERAARLFAAAARLRKAMGATMSNNDHLEYENYLTLVHEQLDHATFESQWSDGFTMTTEKIIADLDEWSANSMNGPIQGVAPVPGIQTANH